jgi:hypothetical protein
LNVVPHLAEGERTLFREHAVHDDIVEPRNFLRRIKDVETVVGPLGVFRAAEPDELGRKIEAGVINVVSMDLLQILIKMGRSTSQIEKPHGRMSVVTNDVQHDAVPSPSVFGVRPIDSAVIVAVRAQTRFVVRDELAVFGRTLHGILPTADAAVIRNSA